MPLTTQMLRTATKWFATSQKQREICKTFYSFTYLYSSSCDAIKSYLMNKIASHYSVNTFRTHLNPTGYPESGWYSASFRI